MNDKFKPYRKHLFTVGELIDHLNEMVSRDVGLYDAEILFDGVDRYERWDGTSDHYPAHLLSDNKAGQVILGYYADLWVREENDSE